MSARVKALAGVEIRVESFGNVARLCLSLETDVECPEIGLNERGAQIVFSKTHNARHGRNLQVKKHLNFSNSQSQTGLGTDPLCSEAYK